MYKNTNQDYREHHSQLLREAAYDLNIEDMLRFISWGAKLDTLDPETGEGIPHILVDQADEEREELCIKAINELMKHRKDIVSLKNTRGETPLYNAISKGRPKLIDHLLTKEVVRNNKGETPFEYAFFNLEGERRQAILASLKQRAFYFSDPLYEAAYQGNVDFLKTFPKEEIVKKRDGAKRSIRDYAERNGQKEVCELFDTYEKEVKSSSNASSLESDASSYSKMTQSLTLNNLNVSTKIKPSLIPTFTFVFFDLIKKGATADTLEGIYYSLKENGTTDPLKLTDAETNVPPLHLAVLYGNEELVLTLCEKLKADVNHRAPDKRTPLYIATAMGLVNICRILLAYNADPHAQYKGQTPYDLAEKLENNELMGILGQAMVEQQESQKAVETKPSIATSTSPSESAPTAFAVVQDPMPLLETISTPLGDFFKEDLLHTLATTAVASQSTSPTSGPNKGIKRPREDETGADINSRPPKSPSHST